MFKYEKLKSDSVYPHFDNESRDPLHPYAPAHYGIFELLIPVADKQRRMIAYVPKDVRESTAGVLVLGENGKTADDLLLESGWVEIADTEERKEKLIVFFLEPENGIWNVNEPYGIPDGDVAYVNAAAQTAAERYLFCVHESKFYLMGCKEGGVIANMEAAWNPAFFAGIVTVGGSAVLPDFLKAAGEDFALNLDGYEDPAHRKNIYKANIPMPAWIIDDPGTDTGTGTAILSYWKTANQTEETPRMLRPDVHEYYRTLEVPYAPNQEKEAFRVCYSCITGASEQFAKPMLRRIWKDFLYHQRRWMSGPGGDLRITRDPVDDLNMEYHYEEFDGWMREWYVYIPNQVKMNPNKKVPLVLAMHGYTCNGEIYSGNSEWFKVAEQYGFIVVHPTALYAHVNMREQGLLPESTPLTAWNIFQEDDRPDELRFFHYLLDKMIADYPVDKACIFATGHSWGSLMTEMLALGMTDRLAAVAPCSGVFFGGASKIMMDLPQLNPYNGKQLPIWMFWGMEEEWLIQGMPTHENETGITLEMWLKKNQKSEMIPEDWDSVVGIQNGRFMDYEFKKECTAPVRFTIVDYMPHATMTEMSFRIWEEFFSRYVC